MISSFSDKATEDLFHGRRSKKVLKIPHDIHSIAIRKLDLLNSAHKLDDLKIPPGNRLHALEDDLKGYHSISINDQWRIVFKWLNSSPSEVKIMDYH